MFKYTYILLPTLLLSSMSVTANSETSTPAVQANPTIGYANLKNYYANTYPNFKSLLNSPTNKVEKGKAISTKDGTKVELFPKVLNNSPFINHKIDTTYRLHYEPNNLQFNNIYLGALYSGKRIKNYPDNFNQWKSPNLNSVYLFGNVKSATNNIEFNTNTKNQILRADRNFLKNSVLPLNADATFISASLDSNSKSNSEKIELGAGYGIVSVEAGYGSSSSSNDTVIKVAAISKVYSLEVNEVSGVTSTNNTDRSQFIQYLNPSEYPVYVSSIDYGFTIIANIKISSLSESTQNSLKAEVSKGIASGNVSLNLEKALGNQKVNVEYEYYGITAPAGMQYDNADVKQIVSKMETISANYMKNFSRNQKPGIPLSATFKYLYPADANSNANFVRINDLINMNKYFAIAQEKFEPIRAKVTDGHMSGVQSGWTYDYETIGVNLADNRNYNNVSSSKWWFYTPSKRRQSASYEKYYNGGHETFSIRNPEIDSLGNFYVYGKFERQTAGGASPRNSVRFNQWVRSDKPLHLSQLKSSNDAQVTFFGGDIEFTLNFRK